jgi:hypothetical protein
MKKFSMILAAMFILCMSNSNATVKSEIENANKAGNSVFLVVTDAQVTGTDKALEIANKAHENYSKSNVIIMNRTEAANQELVTKYQLSGAPLPLILVVATNGLVAGGYNLEQATPELLVKAVPSPKKADVMKALSEGKSVFMVVSSKSMKKSDLVSTCQKACTEMENNAKIIEVDQDDAMEKTFLSELNVSPSITEPQTYVINSKGQVMGNFSSDVNSTTLVATAKKVSGGGCCPIGSGKSCGPTKK